MIIHLIAVGFLTAAASLAVIEEDPANYSLQTPKNRSKLICEIVVGIWILILAWQEIDQCCRLVLAAFKL